jgi:UDP-GlcNAc:undecaprenyl-phosphate/decaprenyl-phosphate GlcNAc-1-phosphate transferase
MTHTIPYLFAAAAACAVVLVGGPWFRRTAWRMGLVDRPKLRGVHAEPVARSGGLVIATALMVALLVQMITARSLGVHDAYLGDLNHLYLLMPAMLLMGLGVVDDIKPLGAPVKLLVQALCGVVVWFLDFRIDAVMLTGLAEFSVGWLSLPLTVLFVVALTNAFNMIDGVDGLCAGTAFVALFGIGAYALLGGRIELALAIPLAVAALAFLRDNLTAPKAFLGDSGSMLLGFMIAALALRAVTTEAGALNVIPLFLLLSLPVMDICFVVTRRLIQGANPLRADRGHIHHILLLLWGSRERRVFATLLGMQVISSACVLAVGVNPLVTGLALALPIGLYMTVYAAGGFLSARNLRNAGPSTDIATVLAAHARDEAARDTLARPEMIKLLEATGVTAIGLFNESGKRVWSIGVPTTERRTLTLPLYAAGRVRCGRLHLQTDGRTGGLAFAAHMLQPLFPAFMDVLEAEAPQRITRKIKEATVV